MVGSTLVGLRGRIEALASAEGAYYLVCARTGHRPVPTAGLRFDDREAARSAAHAVERYRATLRRYDPRVPYHDVIVSQDDAELAATPGTDDGRQGGGEDGEEIPDSSDWTLSDPILDDALVGSSNRGLVEFCHRVAAAVFETLSEDGHDAAERAVMNAYADLAETVGDPDDLCLCLLESMATALDARLSPAELADVLADAAARLTHLDPDDGPLSATLCSLQGCGLIGDYRQSPRSADLDGDTRTVDVRLSDYALSPRQGRLPVLPIVIGLYRRQPDPPLSSLRVADIEGGWRITLALSTDAEPNGLVSAPINADA
ncbi:MAG: hypothetical protein V5A16_01385 [Haloplanus sp.]